jgi:DNA-binding response OmpR family regulator
MPILSPGAGPPRKVAGSLVSRPSARHNAGYRRGIRAVRARDHAMPSGNVLIVEDEHETNAILAGLVRARGLTPIPLHRGAEVLAAIRRHQPELVLLDLMLPDLDGFAVCEQLKKDRETNLIPVVMVTALNDVNHHLHGVRVGANGYVTKPFTTEKIHKAIDEALAWSREHRLRGTKGEVQFDVRGELAYLQDMNDMLADLYAHTPLTERQIKDLKQALLEMGGNAIEWGHKKDADLPLNVTYRIGPDHVTLVIKDQGPGFDPRTLPHAASEENPVGHLDVRNELGLREGGFGIMLARGLVDEFRYNDKGNEVTLVKRFEPTGED